MPQTEPFIIALETSGRMGSIAVGRGSELLVERQFSHEMKHAAELMPTIEALCRETGHLASDIAQIYVSAGPGSFTGLRIAISIARAISQAIGCKLVAIPTVDVLAMNAPPEAERLAIILDAKRGQVFGAYYQRLQGDTLPNGLQRLGGPVLIDPAELVRLAGAGGPVTVLGEGIPYHREALVGAIETPPELWRARAGAVFQIGRVMAQRGEFTEVNQLLPTYIRLAEAEEVWRKKHGLPL